MRAAATPAIKASKVYKRFRDAILTGRVNPGTYLREREVATKLGVSRTPVREALRQLERDSLVRLVPHVGAEVREVSLQDLFEVLEMRRCLEPPAARKAAPRLTAAALAELQRIRQTFAAAPAAEASPATIDRHITADRTLHGLILDLAGNQRISKTIKSLSDTIQRYRYLGIPHRFHRSAREHLDLIDALLQRDGVGAETAMARHLDQFTEDMRTLLLGRPGGDVALQPSSPAPTRSRERAASQSVVRAPRRP